MSIATLKKKSKHIHSKNIGKGSDGFSIYGNRRILSSSLVGADSFNRSKNRTRFKGSEPVGHGGCCGKYNKKIMNSGRQNFNDMSEVKPSVKNTKGMLTTRFKWLSRPYPYYWVQPTSQTYGYEDYLKRLSCNNSLPGDASGKCTSGTCTTGNKVGTYFSDPSHLDYATYLKTHLLTKKCILTSGYFENNKEAYPPYVNRTGEGCWD